MPITKVWIEEGCIFCQFSSETCPEVFEFDYDNPKNTVKKNVDYAKYEEEIKEAADGCPSQVIKYKEE